MNIFNFFILEEFYILISCLDTLIIIEKLFNNYKIEKYFYYLI